MNNDQTLPTLPPGSLPEAVFVQADDGMFDNCRAGESLTWRVSPDIGTGTVTFGKVANDLYVAASDIVLTRPLNMEIAGGKFIRFRTWLTHRYCLVAPAGTPQQVFGPHSSIALVPAQASQTILLEADIRLRFTTVYTEVANLQQLLGSDPAMLSAMPDCASGERLQASYAPIDRDVGAAASDLLDPPFRGRAARALADSRALEIVVRMLQSASLAQTRPAAGAPLNAATIDRLNRAKDTLDAAILQPPGIDLLVRICGLGRTNLVQGFHRQFGETIAGYVLRRRMEVARGLLQTRAMSVGQVAEHVGYRHQSTFSAAFHQHFGYSPKGVRI